MQEVVTSHLFLPGIARQVGQGGLDELVVLEISVVGVGVSVDGEDGLVVGGTGDDMGVDESVGVVERPDVGCSVDVGSVGVSSVGVGSVGVGSVGVGSVGVGSSVAVGSSLDIESCIDVADFVDICDSVGVGSSVDMGDPVDISESVGVGDSVVGSSVGSNGFVVIIIVSSVDMGDSVRVGWSVDTWDSSVEVEDADSVSLEEAEEPKVDVALIVDMARLLDCI